VPTPAIASRDHVRVARIGGGTPLGSDEAGGKGASLDRLTRLGWPVPPAIAVTAAAFRDQLVAVRARHPLAELTAALPDPEARAAIVAAFEATPTIQAIRAEIDAGVAALVADVASATAGASAGAGDLPSFAVRSSALDEDGATASFAGLHDTELGRTADEIEPAIRRCWASLWSIPAIGYRGRRGLPLHDLAMAVVVQVLVPATESAVIFTRHPVTGREDRILLTAIRGLGEPMVSGEATPDTIVVDRATRTIVERDPGQPGVRQFVEGGRIVERNDTLTTPALSDDAIAGLVELALAVEGRAGHPVDVEAARSGSTWFLLQSRPITTH
jgi:phosphoenolpyruvate synthase/pyruvate phosphate dikinase